MVKPVFRKTGVLLAAFVAVGVCAVGYQLSSHRQYQQRVAYAKSSVAQEKQRLNALEKQVNAFYQNDKEKQFINQDVKAADVTKVKAEVDGVKVTAKDFQIKDKSLPSNVKTLANKKRQVDKDVDDVSDKVSLQEKISQLFTKDISNWQKFDDSMVIKDKLTAEQVGDINDELAFFAKGDWKGLAQDYVSSASDQLELVEKIQKDIKKYKKETITYDQYLKLLNQIDQVGNKKVRDSFKKDTDKFADRIGVESGRKPDTDTSSEIDNGTEVDPNAGTDTETDAGLY